MFAMLTQLVEILDRFGSRLLAARRAGKDAEVAAAVLGCATRLQDLCVRGGRLLVLARELTDGAAEAGAVREFGELVEQQTAAVADLRATLDACQPLLATLDATVHLELVPFLDQKSGLLTRWSQQAALSRYSTTTLFFLPAPALDGVIAAARPHATGQGLAVDRSEYLLAVTDAVRAVRSREVRDLRAGLTAADRAAVRAEIAAARAELTRAEGHCERVLTAVRDTVGPEAMARLRRSLVPRSR
ncbi:hypothetical protein ABZ901_32070 [Actinacidiphila alni]|uniref:hypothetical protein n=1 Tax=Actinacidiphila alni TaxID=380248 RepID=UPI0033CD43CE